jgi:hypothetical protein
LRHGEAGRRERRITLPEVAVLICHPAGFFSWNYSVEGASAPAELTFNHWSEQGTITLGSVEYAVRKQGLFSGAWTLEAPDGTYASADEPSFFFRRFELRSAYANLRVAARSAFTSSFDLESDSRLVGHIRVAHAFTYRAHIECDNTIPELDQLFAFWLVVLTWRRAASSD